MVEVVEVCHVAVCRLDPQHSDPLDRYIACHLPPLPTSARRTRTAESSDRGPTDEVTATVRVVRRTRMARGGARVAHLTAGAAVNSTVHSCR